VKKRLPLKLVNQDGLKELERALPLLLLIKKKRQKDFGRSARLVIIFATSSELKESLFICSKCNFHHRIGSDEYFDILFDETQCTELFDNIKSKDALNFTDLKNYQKRLDEIHAKTDLKDSMRVAVGKI